VLAPGLLVLPVLVLGLLVPKGLQILLSQAAQGAGVR